MRRVFWIMGPTSSGKTTIAEKLTLTLKTRKASVIHYDGDEVRDFFGPNLGFAKEDRMRVVKTIVHLANKSIDSGLNVVVSALTANDDARSYIRENVKNLKIVYLECSKEECILRDPKGLYKKAIQGKIDTLAGFNTDYKPIEKPDILVNTEKNSIRDVVSFLSEICFDSLATANSFEYNL